jgi:hypothetical protein
MSVIQRLERVRQRLDRGQERPLQALEARGVRHRQLDLVDDAGEQAHAAVVEAVGIGARADDDAPQAVAVEAERGDREPAAREVACPADGELGGVELERLVGLQQLAGALVRKPQLLEDPRVAPVVAEEGPHDEVVPGALLQPDGRARPLEEPGRELDRPVEHLVQRFGERQAPAEVEERVRDLERGLRALRLAALRLVEPRVLERDGGVAAEHLEHADVVLVEPADAELRDDDGADDARVVVERHGDHRLVHVVRARDRDPVLAVERVREQDRLAGLGGAAGDALADLAGELLDALVLVRVDVAAPGDRHELVSGDDVDAAAVVVDEHPELVDDRLADLPHVVQAVELARQALQHLQVRDRAHVAPARRRRRPLAGLLLEEDGLVLAARLRGHHRDLRAGDELARVHGVLRALGDPDRDAELPGGPHVGLGERVDDPARQAERVAGVARGHDHAELLAAEAADDVRGADDPAEEVGELDEHDVADAVAVDVVHALEVVEVEHEDGDRVVRPACPVQLGAEAVVEVAVVVEARERVGLRLELQGGAHLRVVERERGGVAEALRQLELLVGEDGADAEAVDVERALDRPAGDEGDGDERLGLVVGGPGDRLHARVEVRVVDELRLAVVDRPAGDALAQDGAVAHDLVRPAVARHHGDEQPPGLVGLVDREGVVGDDVGERVRDALEDGRVGLLREDLVEHVREAAVGVDEPVGARLGRDDRGRLGRPGVQAVHLSEFHAAAATSSSRLLQREPDELNPAREPAPSLERVIWPPHPECARMPLLRTREEGGGCLITGFA